MNWKDYNKLKPAILDWLASTVNYKFKHHFSDTWINCTIWDNQLSISLDFRQDSHKELFKKLPNKYKGCLQYGTGKLVNDKTLYFNIENLIDINYPEITNSTLLRRNKVRGGKGGWYSASDDFYTYDWEVQLDDGTTINYHNQINKMDMIKGDFIYNAEIQEREFVKFLNTEENL